MEIYLTTSLESALEIGDRFLKALKNEGLLLENETLYCNPIKNLNNEYGVRIWPNDIELNKNYRDVILLEMTEEEKNDLRVIEKDDEIWFPNSVEDKNKPHNH